MVNKLEAPGCRLCDLLVQAGIAFFGEELPIFQDLMSQVTADCKLLIGNGTKLMVMPVAAIPDRVGPTCPQILLNH